MPATRRLRHIKATPAIAWQIVGGNVMDDLIFLWYIDLLNINLENDRVRGAKEANTPAGERVS